MAGIGYVSEIDLGEGDGHGGHDLRRAGGGKGYVQVPHLTLLGLGEALEG